MNIPSNGASSTPDRKNTTLQSHVAFFDPDGDGIIWPTDTYRGFRVLGFSILFSFLAAVVIHMAFSYPTFGTIIPDPFFRLSIKNIHRAKHGSSTNSYTPNGEFDQRRFDYVFNLYSKEPHTHLDFWEGVKMLYGNRDTFDFFGWTAASLEWLATYLMLWPSDRRLKREDVLAIYDGSMFSRVANRTGADIRFKWPNTSGMGSDKFSQ